MLSGRSAGSLAIMLAIRFENSGVTARLAAINGGTGDRRCLVNSSSVLMPVYGNRPATNSYNTQPKL